MQISDHPLQRKRTISSYRQGKPVGRVDVVGRVGCLDDHALALERVAGEIHLVACAAPGIFDLAAREIWGDEDAGEAVGKRVVDGPRLLVGAEVGIPAVAPGAGVDASGLVVDAARQDGPIEGSLVLPSTRRLAAVPESCGDGLSRNVEIDTPGAEDQQAQDEEEEGVARVKGRHCVIGSLMRAERRWGIIYSQGSSQCQKDVADLH